MFTNSIDVEKVKACVKDSDIDASDNTLLKADYAKLKELNDWNYPALYINGDLYRVSS